MKDWWRQRWWARFGGPLLVLALALAVELLKQAGYRVPMSSALLDLGIVYAALTGGSISGYLSAGIALIYLVLHLSEPGLWFTYSGRRLLHLEVLLFTYPLTAWIVGSLRSQVDRQRQALSKVKEELQSAQMLTSNALDIICATDSRGRFIEVNEACTAILGYSKQELLGMPFIDFVYHKDVAATNQAASAILAGQRLEGFENRCVHKDGSLVDISWSAHWSVRDKIMVGVGRNMTELKRMQRQLSENEQRYRSLFDFHPDAVFALDMEGRFLSGNAAVERITGYRLEQATGMPFLPVVAKRDRDRVEQHFRLAVQGQGQSYDMSGYRSDGSQFHVNVSNLPIVVDGAIVGVYGIAKDISAQLQTRQDLSAAETRLAQAEKLASIGQLAAGVAHEVNNPLGYVNSNLTVLSRHAAKLLQLLDAYRATEGQLDAELPASRNLMATKAGIDLNYVRADLAEVVADAREGIGRVSKIVQSLRDFSRREQSVQAVSADLHQALDSTLNIAMNEIRFKAQVIKEYGQLPLVECVVGEISQVFMNLIVNAAQAMETRGLITIRTWQDGEEVKIRVSDTGVGIAPEVQHRIFEPFYTTKPVGQGTGLGLAISYGIVQKHRGRIELESTLGHGSSFTVTLPVRAELEAVQPAAATASL
jgi:PAS domain S-box-containing protein